MRVKNFSLRMVDFGKTVLDDKFAESGVLSVRDGGKGMVTEKVGAIESVVVGEEMPEEVVVAGKVGFGLNNGLGVVNRVELLVDEFGFDFEKKRSLRIGELGTKSGNGRGVAGKGLKKNRE